MRFSSADVRGVRDPYSAVVDHAYSSMDGALREVGDDLAWRVTDLRQTIPWKGWWVGVEDLHGCAAMFNPDGYNARAQLRGDVRC